MSYITYQAWYPCSNDTNLAEIDKISLVSIIIYIHVHAMQPHATYHNALLHAYFYV